MIISKGCIKDNIDITDNKEDKGYHVYEIKKGNHYTDNKPIIPIIISNQIDHIYIDAIFKETCLYRLHDQTDQWDTNKLIGLSDDYNHHRNSIRWGWTSTLDGRIIIKAYAYTAGHRIIIPIDTIYPNTTHTYRIAIDDSHYHMAMDNHRIMIPRASRHKGPRYPLYPYFGGNQTAPHDMQIHIKSIE